MNFLTVQIKAKRLTPQKIETDLFRFIKSIEKEIFDLNIRQLEKAEGSDGGVLINSNSKFSGVYQQLTVDIAASENPILPKKLGELYNFGWSGDFLGGFEMKLFSDSVEIFSTGTGGGEKKSFFDGYKSLFGLSPESIFEIIERRVKPFLITYFRKQLV